MDSGLIVLVVVTVIFAGLLIVLANWTRPKLNKKQFMAKWQKIASEKNTTAQIVYADNLVDEAMRKININGQTMGERLNNSGAFIKDINSVWQAHKIRNKLVHESSASVTSSESARCIRIYKKALKDMGAL